MFPTAHIRWSRPSTTDFHATPSVRCYARKASRGKRGLTSGFDINDPRLISFANALEVMPSELRPVFSTTYNFKRYYNSMLNGDHKALAATAKHLQQLLGLGSKQQLIGR
eukprot:jgi/Chrzof1/6617/Cz19g02240.t1